MIRPTSPADTEALVRLTTETEMFRPIEIEALQEVLDDYHATNRELGHHSATCEKEGQVFGFVYWAPAAMTDRSYHLWWIVVKKDQQAQGLGGEMLRHAEAAIQKDGGRVLFIETGSMAHYDPTRKFYRKHGYEEHAVLKDFYAVGDSMVVFRKEM